MCHQPAILQAARLVLPGIAHREAGPRMLERSAPFGRGWEGGATATAQSGGIDQADELLAISIGPSALERSETRERAGVRGHTCRASAAGAPANWPISSRAEAMRYATSSCVNASGSLCRGFVPSRKVPI